MRVHLKDDYILNTETKEGKDVVVETDNPCGTPGLIFGGLLILGGIWTLVKSAYKNGCKDYNRAELKTLEDLGLVRPAEGKGFEVG